MKIKIRIKRKAQITILTAMLVATAVHIGIPKVQGIVTPTEGVEVVLGEQVEPVEDKEIDKEVQAIAPEINQKEEIEYKEISNTEENKPAPKGIEEVGSKLQDLGETKEVVENQETKGIEIEEVKETPKPGEEKTRMSKPTRGGYTRQIGGVYNVSAYDLSFQSCGKEMDHPLYGITANGESLIGKSREQAMTIAADTNVIPMDSKVYVEFTAKGYEHFSGVYTVKDRGGAIKGGKIDLFMGDFNQRGPSKEALEFGRSSAKIYRIDE